MINSTFCTIITKSHLAFSQALHFSLSGEKKINFHVLITDTEDKIALPGITTHTLKKVISDSETGQKISAKYNNTPDELRWSLKPIFINYLFDNGYDKVIFTDPDTFYFSDFSFLFNELDEHNILLTPHWRGLDLTVDQSNFDLQFVGGLFNAGFIGVNQKAVKVMDWWAKCCLHKCVKDFSIGQFVDQTYLNLIPIYFDKVKILKHQGCNVANWNQVVCKRELKNGKVLINDSWEIVFIHFTKSTIKGIVQGKDTLLADHLAKYIDTLAKNGKELIINDYFPKRVSKNNNLKKLTHWLKKRSTGNS
ncbi:MAG: hypothetical protein JXQ96_00240 [Cyclobacteriaceae bacterium]